MQESSQGVGRAALRRIPKQERSRERIGEILKVAKELIGRKGIDAVTMKEIAAFSGGPIASVSQYFPNKSAIIAMLYEVYVAEVHELIAGHVTKIETAEDALQATDDLFDLYYERMRAEPSTQDLLNAIQADKALADLDIAETRLQAEVFYQATSHFVAENLRESYAQTLFVMFHMAGATLRLALMVPDEASQLVNQFKSIVRTHATYYLLGRFPETV
jgi:AcrR family transcriptional regulator